MCLCLSIWEKEEYSREVEGKRAKGNPSSTFIAYATFPNRVFFARKAVGKTISSKATS